jgi:hypothetical protein
MVIISRAAALHTDYFLHHNYKVLKQPMNFFFNRMKNKNITGEEYNMCVNAWKDNNMKTFKDFLES